MTKIFKGKELFINNLDFKSRCKNKIEVNEKIYSRVCIRFPTKCDFIAYDRYNLRFHNLLIVT